MKMHRMWLVGLLSGVVSMPAWANENDVPAAAIDACKERSVEGTQYAVSDARVSRTVTLEVNRFEVDISSPAGGIRCIVTADGEIFSADEIEES